MTQAVAGWAQGLKFIGAYKRGKIDKCALERGGRSGPAVLRGKKNFQNC